MLSRPSGNLARQWSVYKLVFRGCSAGLDFLLLFSYTVLHASASHSQVLRGVLQRVWPRRFFRHRWLSFNFYLRGLPSLRRETEVSAL
jgi:hypothetical protein